MVGGGSLKDYNHAERRLWQDAPAILSQIGLKPGDTLADIGSGDGYFSIPAAKVVGNSGKVYALDLSAEAIAELKAAASIAGLNNIQTAVGEAETTLLCKGCADVVLMANVLHDFADPVAALKNARLMLKPGGRLANLDWKKEKDQLHGPPFAKRFDQEKATALLNQAGFKVMSSALVGPFHYLLIAEPV
ncbi:MAG: class I SAM-dependent methyltransferase [Dehalococcoidia bacterium]|nr:MAG: class I SAM-dependent methyltransferase [Dehalococcoidia bacterium]